MKSNKNIYHFFKRVVDIIFSLIGCIMLAPLTVVIMLANLLAGDNGPVFYSQKRYGKDGKAFQLYKYRSMVMGAERKLKNYLKKNPEAKQEFDEFKKLKNDPRVTPVGKFLRKTSLDEFPQFINILKGEMSLIGPRPVVLDEIKKYGKNKDKFLSVKPGLTGYWQANGRSNTSYDERIEMELFYVDNASFWLDIKIFFKTFISVFKGEGAV